MNYMEQDLEILKKILRGQGIAENMIDVLVSHITKELNKSGKTKLTPQFLYVHLAFEIGRNMARDVSEEFDDYNKTGEYKSKLQRYLDRSPWMK